MPADTADVTRLLTDLAAGNRGAADALLPLVYKELCGLASSRLRREREGHTLATTDLVHEAYLRLVDVTQVEWRDRGHFFAAAAGAMRRVLVDWARARQADKRGGTAMPLSLDSLADQGILAAAPMRADDLLALDEALVRLAGLSERQARVVECRFFAGLSAEETAAALDVSEKTVQRDWRLARAWLYRETHPDAD
ncbi:MAG TPA: sigma-70 family RNA polymerase sigma factor [Rubricoccaceae bacterium]